MPRFDLELFLRYIQDYRITHLYLVPPHRGGAGETAARGRSMICPRCATFCREPHPLDGAMQQAVAARLHVPVVQGYGMTETSLAIALTPPDPANVKAGSGGGIDPKP